MIFSKVENPKKSSTKAARASGVVNYITAPENENALEKCVYHEAVNFISDNLKSQTAEMISLSQEAVKSKDPIEHFVISWKSNERPTPEQASEAAAILIGQCGLTGHQYIIGLHDDTDNMHLHITVNRVHPDTFKVVKINKGFDKEAGHQAIAIIEKVQGWSSEVNARYRTSDKAELIIDPATKRPQIFESAEKLQQPTAKAQAMEIQTGQKSAQRVGIEQAAPIIAQATSWKELHANMAVAGMQYQRKGSGAVVQVGDELVKASDIDRKASLTALQKRFGPYQPPQEIKPNEYHHHTKEQNPIAFGENAGNGMRKLSQCNLAVLTNQGQIRRSRVLHADARSGGRPVDGLRRGAGRAAGDTRSPRSGTEGIRSTATNGREIKGHGTLVFHQPLNQNQHGWNEYIAIRDAQKTAKNIETIDLQKRHGAERAALAAKQKAERADVFSGNWKGKGDAKNALQSIIATQQAAEKMGLSEQQRDERNKLQTKYKPLPMYKVWKEQPQIVGEELQILQITPTQPRLSQILKSLSRTIDQHHHTTYALHGRSVFRDEGRVIQVLDLKSDEGIAAALATAQQKFGNVLTLTGSTEFQQNAVAVAVANNLTCRFSDPALEALRARLQATKYQADRAAAAQLEQPKAKAIETPAPALPSAKEMARQQLAAEAAKASQEKTPTADLDPGQSYSADGSEFEAEASDPGTAYDGDDEHYEQRPAVDYLADIHQQIAAAKAAADPRSMLAHSTTTEADHESSDFGVIIASNAEFVAVQRGEVVKLYRTIELTKLLSYDGIATGPARFAPGNQIERKNGKDGMRTLLSEEREAMQTETKRERDTGPGL